MIEPPVFAALRQRTPSPLVPLTSALLVMAAAETSAPTERVVTPSVLETAPPSVDDGASADPR